MAEHEEEGIRELLTPDELAKRLKVSKSWIYQRTMQGPGALPHIKVGKYLRFDADEVMEFIRKQSALN